MTEMAEKLQETSIDVQKDEPKETRTKLESEIIRQIEYYFGDANLNRDKFLQEHISKDDGWVPFSVLLTFKRLAALSTDIDVIVKAMEKSDEGLIEISKDKEKIRRHPERPIPEQNEERRKDITSRTVYVKGFPLDSEMSDLIDFFSPYEKILNINMRKYIDKASKTYKFKGSVFITFSKTEQCEEFINKEKVEYKSTDLIRKWQEQYLEEKKEERAASNKKKAEVQKQEELLKLPKGAVLYFEGSDENTTREHIRDSVTTLGAEIAYIEYSKGESNGYIRFQSENTAEPFLDKLKDKKLKLNDNVVIILRKLTKDEENEYLNNAVEQMKSRRNYQNKHRGGNRKRKPNDVSKDEPPAKQ